MGGQPFLFAQQAKQEMLGTDVAVMGPLGLVLGECEYLLGPFGEPLERVHVFLGHKRIADLTGVPVMCNCLVAHG